MFFFGVTTGRAGKEQNEAREDSESYALENKVARKQHEGLAEKTARVAFCLTVPCWVRSN